MPRCHGVAITAARLLSAVAVAVLAVQAQAGAPNGAPAPGGHFERLPLPLARVLPLVAPGSVGGAGRRGNSGSDVGVGADAADGTAEPPHFVRVASVQMADFVDGVKRNGTQEMADRTAKAVSYIVAAAAAGAQVAVFPEMSLAQYNGPSLAEGTLSQSVAAAQGAESAVAAACKHNNITAIIGVPHFFKPSAPAPGERGARTPSLPPYCTVDKCWYNSALVVGNDGVAVYRQAKMHSAGPDGQVGKWLDVFELPGTGGVVASIQICYDAYFTQMSVLPVLKGSRIIFDMSSERGYDADPYYEYIGSLYQGRAQATGTFVVQANTGAAIADDPAVVHAGRFAGSHGGSQLVSPRGEILAKAPHVGEHLVVADLDVSTVSQGGHSSLSDENAVFSQWWHDGLTLLSPMPLNAA